LKKKKTKLIIIKIDEDKKKPCNDNKYLRTKGKNIKEKKNSLFIFYTLF